MYKWKDSGRILDLIDMMIDSIHVSICCYDKHHGSVMVNSEWASAL